jgi:hypothetical protein
VGIFHDIFGGGDNSANYPGSSHSQQAQGISAAPAGNYGGFSQQAGQSAMGNYYGASNAANQMAAMQMAQAGQWIPDRPRTTVTIGENNEVHIVNGDIVHHRDGLVVMSDLYIQTRPGVSLSGIDKIVKSCKGIVNCSPYVTCILGLLLIEDVESYNLNSGALGPNDGEALTRLFNKYKGTGDIIALQDELIDAGLTNQARL